MWCWWSQDRATAVQALPKASPPRNALPPPELPGYDAPTWTGVIAPAGLPRPVLDKLSNAINRAIVSPTFKERFGSIGDEPAGGTPEEFAAMFKVEFAKWREVVKRSGAKFD